MTIESRRVDLMRRRVALASAGMLLPTAFGGCGGSESTTDGQSKSVGGDAILTSASLPGGTETITSTGRDGGVLGTFYTQPGAGAAAWPVQAISTTSSKSTVDFFFDSSGNLYQWTDRTTNQSTTVVPLSDRAEYRTYTTGGNFVGGAVVYSSAGRWYCGLLDKEEYQSTLELLSVVDITSKIRQLSIDLAGTAGPFAGLSTKRWLLAHLPMSAARAEDGSFDAFAGSLVMSIGGAILVGVALPIAGGAVALYYTESWLAGAAAAALLAFLVASNSHGATPGPTPPLPPVPPEDSNGVPFGLARFAGTYSGTFAGGDTGVVDFQVDSAGALFGSGSSAETGTFSFSGNVTVGGKAAATAGSTSLGSTFSGRFGTTTNPWTISGTWVNLEDMTSGTFKATRT